MAELALVDYFVMGEAVGIVATLFVAFYYSRKQMQKLSVDIETMVLSVYPPANVFGLKWELRQLSLVGS
ncbi:MAG: hypothetical protein WBE61_14615 [Nitrososphaeraceae archaeon]